MVFALSNGASPPPPYIPSCGFLSGKERPGKEKTKEEKDAEKKEAERVKKEREAKEKELKEAKERVAKLEKQVRELECRVEESDAESERLASKFDFSQRKLARLHAAALMAMGALCAIDKQCVANLPYVTEQLQKALFPSNPLPVEVEPYAPPYDDAESA